MPSYKAPIRDTRFVINEVLKLESYSNLPGFESATQDLSDAVIEEGGKFVAEVLAPLNLQGDRQAEMITGQTGGINTGLVLCLCRCHNQK